MIRRSLAANDALNRRDWDALRSYYSPTVEIVDHRVAQPGIYDGRADIFGDIPALIEVTPDLRSTTVAIYPDDHGDVSLVHNTATTAGGGEVENMMIIVGIVRDGVIAHVEYFPEDALGAARARLAELAPRPRTS